MIRWRYIKERRRNGWWSLKENDKLIYFKLTLLKNQEDLIKWNNIIKEHLDVVEALNGTWRFDKAFRLRKLEKG